MQHWGHDRMDSAYLHSLLPFQICQDWQLRVGYERSFKMRSGQVLANRYLLGITTDQLPLNRTLDLSARLAMPQSVPAGFWELYEHANLILIGFEDSQPGCIYKLYLEFDEQHLQVNGLGSTGARLLHRGLKWNPDQPHAIRQTDYVWHPEISAEEMLSRVRAILKDNPVLGNVQSILSRAFERIDPRAFRFLDIHETGTTQNRRSFDLNLYAAELDVESVWDDVQQLAALFQIDPSSLDRLRASVGDRPLGHLAAGTESSGAEFCTVYFEAQP